MTIVKIKRKDNLSISHRYFTSQKLLRKIRNFFKSGLLLQLNILLTTQVVMHYVDINWNHGVQDQLIISFKGGKILSQNMVAYPLIELQIAN